MLQALLNQAKRKGWTTEPGFSRKEVKWAIVCSKAGQFIGIIPLGDPDDKRNKGQTFERAPDLSQGELVSGGVTKSHFLIDSAGTVTLLDVDPNDTSTAAQKARAKHNYFVSLLKQASEVMPQLQTATRVLSDEATLSEIRIHMTKLKIKPTDKVTIQLGVGGPFLVESNAWHDWWRTFRKRLSGQSDEEEVQPEQSEILRPERPVLRKKAQTGQMRDLATGEFVIPTTRHRTKVKGLVNVGGLPTGNVLVGFDKEAFCSYGLKKSLNAAVSEENAKAYAETLNRLIGDSDHCHHLAGVKIIHWYDKPVKKDPVAALDDPLAFLGEVSDKEKELHANEEVRKMLDAIWTGAKDNVNLRDNCYYALTVSGAAGRVMLRDWMQGQFKDIVESIKAWFEDLSIVRPDGDYIAPPSKFIAVLGATVRELDELAAPFITDIWSVAVRRTEPFPRSALSGAIQRFAIRAMNAEYLNPSGVGIMKAFHVRDIRKKGVGFMPGPYLNEDHPSPAYQCGRLLAVLAGLQRAALGDVGAGVVQRFYTAASTTPALVFGRLTTLSQAHLSKLGQEKGGLRYWYESKIADIWCRVKDDVPRTHALEEQSLFALGYYQQIADMRTKKVVTPIPSEEEESNNG